MTLNRENRTKDKIEPQGVLVFRHNTIYNRLKAVR